MTRAPAAAAALALALLWFGWAGSAAFDLLVGLRDPAVLVASGNDAPAPDSSRTAAEREELDRLHQVSEQWAPRAAALLSPEQRARGRRLATAMPRQPPAPSRLLSVEGDLWGLSQALIGHYGAVLVEAPALPEADPWGTLSRRERVRALLALIEAGELETDQAAALLALTLEAMQAQAAGVDLAEGQDRPRSR